ncbi:MAG: hypothetical protein V4713_02680 [Pseudomonadota bacterium]
MKPASFTKLEIAIAQLRLAITLFLEQREFIAVVTLAGAAEEILGKLVAETGQSPALTKHAESARGMYVAMWKTDPGAKVFMDLRNRARNEVKHLRSGASFVGDIEAEAARMLDRAVENYRLLHPRTASFICEYERNRSKS